MSKERLKEIEQKYDMWSNDFNLDPQDVEWLIEQVKRVEELEKENKLLRFIAEENKIAYEQKVKQNKCYREAIILAHYKLGFGIDESVNKDERTRKIFEAKEILKSANVLEGEE